MLSADQQKTLYAALVTVRDTLNVALPLLAPETPTPTPVPMPTPTVGRAPDNPAGAVPGLDYAYYEGTWSLLPEFSKLTPVKTGTVATPTLDVRKREDFFGVQYLGYLDVPSDGAYTFYTKSDDGSQLFIGKQLVVDNNAVQYATEKSGSLNLQKGRHAFLLSYFERDGGQELAVSWQGPNLPKQPIPASAFYRVPPVGAAPAPTPVPVPTPVVVPVVLKPANAPTDFTVKNGWGTFTKSDGSAKEYEYRFTPIA